MAEVKREHHGTSQHSTAYLDGLRGLAALCVFTGHMIGGGLHELAFGQLKGDGSRNYTLISAPIIRILYAGAPAAVSVFFVLSGFVITQSLVNLIHGASELKEIIRSLQSAMIRRPVRLYLPCWAVTLVIALAIHLPYNMYPPLPWLGPEESIPREMSRVVRKTLAFFWPFGEDPVEAFFPYNLVVWTIPIELKGSFMCYGLIALHTLTARRISTPIWTGIMAILSASLLATGAWWQACFVAGYILSIVNVFELDGQLDKPRRSSSAVLHGILFSSALLLSIIQTSGHPEWASEAPGYAWLHGLLPRVYSESRQFYRFWVSLGAIGFVYATLRISWLQRIFNSSPLRYLGKVSFMLYLIHLPLAFCFSDRWIRILGYVPLVADAPTKWWDNLLWLPEWGATGLNVRWFAAWGSVLMVNLLLSHALTVYLDQPTVKLSKTVSGWLGLDRAVALKGTIKAWPSELPR